jgi:nucleoid-associated protein YgaU
MAQAQKLEKATIDVLQGSKAGSHIVVLFNPFEYSIERANAFKATAIPGLSGPLIQFINGEADVLSMELFLDDYTDAPPDGRSVKDRLDDLAGLLEIDRTLHAPSPVRFVWGKLAFTAIIEKLSRKITLFRPDGTPARATLNASFKEYKTLPELVNDPRLESADKSKRRVIVGHDSLWALAAREYGDPERWPAIADRNDLDDPRDIAPGDWVMLPPLDPKGNGSRGLLQR